MITSISLTMTWQTKAKALLLKSLQPVPQELKENLLIPLTDMGFRSGAVQGPHKAILISSQIVLGISGRSIRATWFDWKFPPHQEENSKRNQFTGHFRKTTCGLFQGNTDTSLKKNTADSLGWLSGSLFKFCCHWQRTKSILPLFPVVKGISSKILGSCILKSFSTITLQLTSIHA